MNEQSKGWRSVCLTGGIACGKTRVADWFATKGWGVICSDELVHRFYQSTSDVPQQIAKEFGKKILFPDGSVNRQVLGQMVFGKPEAIARLNAMIHPRVREEWRRQLADHQARQQPAMAVIPLVFETQMDREFDEIWVVACSQKEQLRRLRGRGLDEEGIRQRIAAQWPVQKKIDLAHRVVWNDDEWSMTQQQLERIVISNG